MEEDQYGYSTSDGATYHHQDLSPKYLWVIVITIIVSMFLRLAINKLDTQNKIAYFLYLLVALSWLALMVWSSGILFTYLLEFLI